jgi:hypothetical protein
MSDLIRSTCGEGTAIEQASATGFIDRFTWKGLRFNREEARNDEVCRYVGEDIIYGGKLVMYPNGQWMGSFTPGLVRYGWSKEEALRKALHQKIDHLHYLVRKFEAVEFGEIW